ncbi:HK97 gp10 family phage protein [Oceanobacillus caeni]|uniref:HK97-gp10 family putative phage morphogenesis protein n=1 Tax=Oceanobacillus caeni TaxID=405946 RepID=UPI00214A064E|nr:HK97-gp10 family putative phage morphogenesis protein [Oceanobacillus caeni]MCR1834974.1 HK97 gp10 family phage protein [Oceanobacillus caeni]
MSVKIEGLRELISNLAKKEDDIIRAAKQGNLAGGKVVMEELKRNVPKSGYSGPNPQARLVDAVTMSGNRTDKGTVESYVAVGFNKSANFRAHIPEFGSISQSPQGYMTKTVQATEGKVAKEMADAIKKVLR